MVVWIVRWLLVCVLSPRNEMEKCTPPEWLAGTTRSSSSSTASVNRLTQTDKRHNSLTTINKAYLVCVCATSRCTRAHTNTWHKGCDLRVNVCVRARTHIMYTCAHNSISSQSVDEILVSFFFYLVFFVSVMCAHSSRQPEHTACRVACCACYLWCCARERVVHPANDVNDDGTTNGFTVCLPDKRFHTHISATDSTGDLNVTDYY